MHIILTLRRSSSLLLCALLVAGQGRAQEWREYAVSEADKAGPCSIPWERSLDDALALARESGRPLLVAVCIDGEAASEVFAHKLYKDPEYIHLMQGFVPIVFSPFRHTERDHDESGTRVLCPRFGSVTCGEHAADEPEAYRRWFEGVRYSPRHIGITPDGETVLFDRYLDQDLGRVRRALERHAAPNGSLEAGLERRDSVGRTAIETSYRDGSLTQRLSVLRAIPRSSIEHAELLRMALASVDPNERYYGTAALAANAGPACVELLTQVLNEGRGGGFAPALQARLAALAEVDGPAARGWRILRALDHTGELAPELNLTEWSRRLRLRAAPADGLEGEEEVLARLEQLSEEIDRQPGSPELELEFAAQTLKLARARIAADLSPGFLFQDARGAAERALRAGAFPEEVAVVGAQAAYMSGDSEAALLLALDALPALRSTRAANAAPAAAVLEVLARARTQAIYDAEGATEEWPAEWLAQAHAAFSILDRHPDGSEAQAVAHADLLAYLGARRWLGDQLERVLQRWPRSADLHARVRTQVIATRGALALEGYYDSRAAASLDPAAFAWFHAYATMMRAEEETRRGNGEAADAAYERALARFERSAALEPEFASSSASYSALALVAQARLCWDAEPERAIGLVLAAFERAPECGEWKDGLGVTPIETLGRLRARIRKLDAPEWMERLRSGVEATAPAVWELSDRLPGSPSAPSGPSTPQ